MIISALDLFNISKSSEYASYNSPSKNILFIALFLLAWFDLQPQEIYENGILISTGLVKWSDIQCVESLEMKDHIIKITLINYRFGTKTINLHCFPGLASNFVELISTNVNNNK